MYGSQGRSCLSVRQLFAAGSVGSSCVTGPSLVPFQPLGNATPLLPRVAPVPCPPLCARMREVLQSCLTSNGLDSRMPIDVQARRAAKTGTLLFMDQESGVGLVVRNEAGVLEYPDDGRYAAAVYTRHAGGNPLLRDPAASCAIGTAAELAVEYLRAAANDL